MGRQRRNIHISDGFLYTIKAYIQQKLMVEYAQEIGEVELSDYIDSQNAFAIDIADKIVYLLGIKDKLLPENKQDVEDFYNEGIE